MIAVSRRTSLNNLPAATFPNHHTASTIKMANTDKIKEPLTKIGFNSGTSLATISHGYTTIDKLAELDGDLINKLATHTLKAVMPRKDTGKVVELADIVNFPFAAIQSLKEVHHWYDHCHRLGEPANTVSFTRLECMMTKE